MKLHQITDGIDSYIVETDEPNVWITNHLDLSQQWSVKEWIALPAKHLQRCNDFIFTADYSQFYFNDGLFYVEIKNKSYLADIRASYSQHIKRG